MLNEILARRVLIVLGKGGVGKSTLSAAIAKLAASSGARALVMECDARAPLAATFGVEPSFVPTQVAPNLTLMTLDGRAALEEYLRLVVPGRMLLKAVFASRLYQFFVQAAPARIDDAWQDLLRSRARRRQATSSPDHRRRCARKRTGDQPAQDADGGP